MRMIWLNSKSRISIRIERLSCRRSLRLMRESRLNANLVVLSPETRGLPSQVKRQLNLDLTMLADCPVQRLNAA
jgi:hypothetical protein